MSPDGPDGRIKVLVVDDSAFMRQLISRLLQDEGDICVVGTARDGIEAVEHTRRLEPDVVTLDIEMPRLDGLGALERIMRESPRPVVMLSSLTRPTAAASVVALLRGAVDVVAKPSGSISPDLGLVRDELLRKIRAAARSRPRRRWLDAPAPAAQAQSGRPAAARVWTPPPSARERPARGRVPRTVVVGASTGGPGALRDLFRHVPADLDAAVVVVQHMPPGFTAALAARLDGEVPLAFREAAEGDRLEVGLALVAPGGSHLRIGGEGRVSLDAGPTHHGVRPSIDVTMDSMPLESGAPPVAVILTGMGLDGARGALRIRRAGGAVFCQDRESSVVWGMPGATAELVGDACVLPPPEIAEALVRLVGRCSGDGA